MTRKHLRNLLGDHLHTLPIVVLYLTDGCNSRCITCDIWRNPRRNMDMTLVENIASEVGDLQIRDVVLSGGEAMQHPDWPQITAAFRQAGARILLLTNGLLLQKQAREVVVHVDEVIVSLDAGTAATYQAIRGVDAFDHILDGIRAVRAGNVPVTTRTTIQRANFREMPQVITAALQAGVNHISFLTVDVSSEVAFGPRFEADAQLHIAHLGPGAPPDHGPAASTLTHDNIAEFADILDDIEHQFAQAFASGQIAETPEKLRRMLPYFRAVIGENDYQPPRCNAPHISAVIEVDGTLRSCYFLPAVSSIEALPLAEAINTEPAQAMRRAYRTGQRPECERCVCPLYKGPRSLLRL